jgi:anti-sigma B factor antagonist
MSFDVSSRADQVVTIDIGDALDFRNASDFKALCQEEADAGGRHFVLDFSGTGILDSTGMGAIFSLYRKVSPEDGEVVFAAVSKPVEVVVQLTRTYKVFQQFDDAAEARAALVEEDGASSPASPKRA